MSTLLINLYLFTKAVIFNLQKQDKIKINQKFEIKM